MQDPMKKLCDDAKLAALAATAKLPDSLMAAQTAADLAAQAHQADHLMATAKLSDSLMAAQAMAVQTAADLVAQRHRADSLMATAKLSDSLMAAQTAADLVAQMYRADSLMAAQAMAAQTAADLAAQRHRADPARLVTSTLAFIEQQEQIRRLTLHAVAQLHYRTLGRVPVACG